MRAIVAIVLIIGSTQVEANDFRKHGKDNYFHDRYERDTIRREDSCQIVCEDDSSNKPSSAKYNGWIINYNLPNDLNITITYNQSSNYFASFNTRLQLAGLYAGSIAFVGIYNATSNSAIIINVISGETKFEIDVGIKFSNKINITESFSTFYEYILERSRQPAQTNLFNINGFLEAINNENLDSFFNGQQKIYNGIIANFANLINLLQNNAENGVAAVFRPILTGINVNLTNAINSVIKTSGYFTENFISALFKGIVNISNAYLNTLSNTVGGVGKFYENMQGALNAFFSGSTYNVTSNEIKVGDDNITVDSGISKDNSWLINIGNEAGSTVNMTIHYNASINILAFYNINLKIATIFNGRTGSYAIFNTSSNYGLVISPISGNAKLVYDSKIQNAFKNNKFQIGFLLISKLILRSTSVNNTFNLEHDVFSFRDLLLALAGPDGDYQSQFKNRSELLNKLNNNFGKVFVQTRNYFTTSGNKAPGPLNIFSPIYGVFNLGQNFVNLIGNIFNSSLKGRFNSDLMVNVFGSFISNLENGINGARDFIFGGIVNAIKGVQTVGNDVGKTLQNIFKLPSGNFSLHVKYGY